MAEERFEEGTEPATPRRREEARQRGHVARSQDLTAALLLLGALTALNFFGRDLAGRLGALTVAIFQEMAWLDLTRDNARYLAGAWLIDMAKLLLPFVAAVIATGLAANFLQVGFLFTAEPLGFNLDRINPIEGLGRILSLRGLVRVVASLFKTAVLTTVFGLSIRSEMPALLALARVEPGSLARYLVDVGFLLAFRGALALVILALLDWTYQKWQYERDLRMSRTEIKEELKRLEGDPRIRQRRRSVQVQLAMQRMMAQVPKATVVITNPTEVAVALRYDAETMDAPQVVAKGMGEVAARIRSAALEHGIPLVERPPLARALYKSVDVGGSIPRDLYEAVAEVLAYVFKISRAAASAPVIG